MNTYQQYQHHYAAPQERITFAVQRLILVNVAIFVAQLIVDIPLGYDVTPLTRYAPPGGDVIRLLAFQPGWFLRGCLWKPLTYQFLHGGLMHLFMNMLWLFFFGPTVERVLGTRQFFRFYLTCGTGAVLATFVPYTLTGHGVSVTGASGAVMAVLLAFAVINPERQFYLIPFPVPINARALVVIVIAMNIVFGLGRGSTTSVATHFGGMILGYLYMKYIPLYRRRRTQRRREEDSAEGDVDTVGEMVDNIFKFEKRKR